MNRAQRRIAALAGVASLFAVVGAVAVGWGAVSWWALPLVTALVLGTETAVVHMAVGRQRWTFSLTEALLAGCLVVSPHAWLVVAVTAGVLCAQLVRRQPLLKLGFNVAQFGAATALATVFAAAVTAGTDRPVVGAALGLVTFWFANNVLVAAAVAATTSRSAWGVFRGNATVAAMHGAGTGSMGLLAGWLAGRAPLGLLGLGVPLLLLHSSYDQQTRRAAEAQLFAELAQGHELAAGHSLDTTARAVVTAAARLFGGGDSELVVLRGALAGHGPVRYAGDEHGVHDTHQTELGTLDAAWALHALGSPGVVVGSDGELPYVAVTLGGQESPLALLGVHRQAGGAGFSRRDAVLVGVLARQAETWLNAADAATERDAARDEARSRQAAVESAQRTLGGLADVGAHTAPALGVLRESSARLARLAARPDGTDPVGRIVDELHAVERAVASLLGAVALAADPDLAAVEHSVAGRLPAQPAERAEAEWTTTGLLPAQERR